MVFGTLFDVFQFDLGTILIFGVTFLLVHWWMQNRDRNRNLPPGPVALPIVGNMLQVAGHKKQWLMYMEWSKKYGKLIRVKIGSNLMVVVMGWDHIKEGLVDKAHLFTDRPEWLYAINSIFNHKGLFWSNGQTSKDLRKFTVVHLRDFGVGKKSLEERVQDEATILVEAFGKENGRAMFPRQLLCYAISNIICGIIFGNRFDYDDPAFQELYTKLDFLFKNLGIQLPENFFPILRYLPTPSAATPLVNNDRKLQEYFRVRIAEHRETFDANNIRDFIDMYLKLEDDQEFSDSLTEENVFRIMVDLFLGGSETTATSLLWVLLYLIKYPDVQRKCHKELETVVGDGRQAALSDKASLPYLQATISEVQRIASTVPFAAPHVASADVRMGGHVIPKGTLVLFHIYSAHHDSSYWENPEEFRPERWIGKDGKLRRHDAFLPFSLGPRACLGEPLARMELFLFLTTLLQNFRFEIPDGAPSPSLEPIQPGFPLQPQFFKLCAVRR